MQLLLELSAIIYECHVTHCDCLLSVMFVLGTVFGITFCSLQFWSNSWISFVLSQTKISVLFTN